MTGNGQNRSRRTWSDVPAAFLPTPSSLRAVTLSYRGRAPDLPSTMTGPDRDVGNIQWERQKAALMSGRDSTNLHFFAGTRSENIQGVIVKGRFIRIVYL